mgnify:CR=1 FL=1
MKKGHPQKQAIAMALASAGKSKYKHGSKKHEKAEPMRSKKMEKQRGGKS